MVILTCKCLLKLHCRYQSNDNMAPAGRKNNNNNNNKKPSLKSALAMKGKGTVVSPSGKKDPRHQYITKGYKGGIIQAWLKKHNKNEEAFAAPFLMELDSDEEACKSINCNGVFQRRGEDGKTPLPQAEGSTWGWRSLLFIVDEEENTPKKRKELADAVIAKFNEKATTAHYRYPRKFKWGKDVTEDDMACVDTDGLLDGDIIRLMSHAFSHAMSLEEMTTNEDVMKLFWSDMSTGAAVVNEHVLSHQGQEEED